MFVEIVSEGVEPNGEVKIVIERHRFGFRERLLKRRLIRRADGAWTETPKDAHVSRSALAHLKRRSRGLPTPKQIKELRTSLGLSQRKASRLFGSGPRSFQKYESGTEVVGTAMGRLLWLVKRKPELASELAQFVQW